MGLKENPYTWLSVLFVMSYVVIEHVTECHDWSWSITYLNTTRLNQFHMFTWPNYFQSFDLIQLVSVFWIYLIKSYYLNWFNYFDFDVLHSIFRMEDGERRSQSYYREYDWLGPYPTHNTQGRYTTILPVVLITTTPYSPVQNLYLELGWDHIIYLLWRGYYNLYMFPH